MYGLMLLLQLLLGLGIAVFVLWMQARIGHKAGFSYAGRCVFLFLLLTVVASIGASALANELGWGREFVSYVFGSPFLVLTWLFAYSRWPALEARREQAASQPGVQPSPPSLAQTRPVGPPAPSPGATPPQPALAAELERLSSLHASGALTDEEYARAKKKLLS